jgi:hypothetical protein
MSSVEWLTTLSDVEGQIQISNALMPKKNHIRDAGYPYRLDHLNFGH